MVFEEGITLAQVFDVGRTLAQQFAYSDDDEAEKLLEQTTQQWSDTGRLVYKFVDDSYYIPSLDNPVFVSASELRSRLDEF